MLSLLQEHQANRTHGGSIYVSGVPGTGRPSPRYCQNNNCYLPVAAPRSSGVLSAPLTGHGMTPHVLLLKPCRPEVKRQIAFSASRMFACKCASSCISRSYGPSLWHCRQVADCPRSSKKLLGQQRRGQRRHHSGARNRLYKLYQPAAPAGSLQACFGGFQKPSGTHQRRAHLLSRQVTCSHRSA